MLPCDIREIKCQRRPVVVSRAAGITSFTIIPITIESLVRGAEVMSAVTYKCLLSNDRTFEAAQEFMSAKGDGWLHVSLSGQADADIRDFSNDRFLKYILQRTAQLKERGQADEIFTDSIRDLLSPKRPPWSRLQFPGYAHGITRPNEIIAASIDSKISLEKRLAVNRVEEYVPAVVKSCRAVLSLRRKLAADVPVENGMCLTVEPILWHLHRADVDRELFDKVDECKEVISALRRLVKSIKKPGGYTKLSIADNEKDLVGLLKNKTISAFLKAYQMELRAFGTSLALLNASELTPVLRLESKINSIKGDLVNLSACARGGNPHVKFKSSKLAQKIQTAMKSLVSLEHHKLINDTLPEFTGVVLLGDIPLEWLPLRDLPLTLRCDVSRISATPGNLSLQQCLRNQYISVAQADFEEVLIVRSFHEGDRIRTVLEDAISKLSSMHKAFPKCKIVDVESVEEFVLAVNSFSGAMMIFDGHGTIADNTGVGSIVVGGEAIDVWKLRDSIRMPPVVLLSACDTLPLDGGHGASANGMLALGAVTVLGTVLPIDSGRAAGFIGRLLLRVQEYLPIVLKRSSYLPWRSFMSGMLRMTYCTELIISLIEDAKIISPKDWAGIQAKANFSINTLNPEWFEVIVNEVTACSGLERCVVREKCLFWGSLVDSLKYIQLGRPEKIRLRPHSLGDVISAMLAEKSIPQSAVPMMDVYPGLFVHSEQFIRMDLNKG